METLTIAACVGILLILVVLFVAICYVKAPTNVTYIISGLRKKPRFLNGQGGIKIPIFERKDELYLGQVTVDVKTDSSAPTSDFINVDVDAVANVQVKPDVESRLVASQHFLNKSPEQISTVLRPILQGNLREIIGTMDLKALNNDRNTFATRVALSAKEDMEQMGLRILSFNIQEITDREGLIKDLGADNTAKIKKDAAINKALAERDIAIESAKATKEANDAKVAAELEIAQKQNDLSIKKAELKKASDIKKAEADLQYEITKQERQRELNVSTVNAQIEKTRKDQELTEQIKTVNANKLEVTIKQTADADKYRVEQEAKATLEQRKRQAEAELYLAEQTASAKKASAEAARYEQEQEALAIKAKGEAEAAAIKAKGEAEANAKQAFLEAEAEGMRKKAEAYKMYNDAAMAQMIIDKLPEMAVAMAEPISSIKDVHIYGSNANGITSMSGNVATGLKQVIDLAKDTTGLDIMGILSNFGKKNSEPMQLND